MWYFTTTKDNLTIKAHFLAPVQLAHKGCDVRVGSVDTWREEVGLDGQILFGGGDVPHSDLCDHRFDGLVFIPDVVLLQLLDILSIGGRDDGLDCHIVHHLLEGVLLPLDLMVILDMEELAPPCVVLNFWVGDLKLGKTLAVEGVVPGGETHFGLAEDEHEETMLATRFGGCEMAFEDRNLIGEVSHGVEGGSYHDLVKRDGFHPLLTILVMTLTVIVIATMFAPFVRLKIIN